MTPRKESEAVPEEFATRGETGRTLVVDGQVYPFDLNADDSSEAVREIQRAHRRVVKDAVNDARFKFSPRWVYVVDRLPKGAGWFYTNSEGHISMRYFDDSDKSWWLSTRRDGWTPNGSFLYWLEIEIPLAQEAQDARP